MLQPNYVSVSLGFARYQDANTQAFFMVVSCNRWLAVRLDLLSSIFVTIVALGAILMSENSGEFMKAVLCNNCTEISPLLFGGGQFNPHLAYYASLFEIGPGERKTNPRPPRNVSLILLLRYHTCLPQL